MATKAFLEQAYLAYFGRPIDPNGVAAFVNATETEVENAFWASPESQALYGSVFGLQQINMVYNMLFGRDAEPAGLAYWANQIVIGALTPAGAAIGILRGALNDDVIALNNKLAASAAFTAGLDTTEEILGFAGDQSAAVARAFLASITMTPATQAEVDAAIVAAVAVGTGTIGETFTLTTGVDGLPAFQGGNDNDTFFGFLGSSDMTTAQPFDVINGGGGADNFVLTMGDSNSTSWAMASVEDVTLRTTAGSAADSDWYTIDASSWTGVKNLTINATSSDSDGGISVDFLAADLDTLTISGVDTNTDSSSFDVYVNTDDTVPLSIQNVVIENINGSATVDIGNGTLQNIPTLYLTNVAHSTDEYSLDVTLEVANSVGAGTNDTLTVVAENAGAMNYDYWTSTDIDLYNADSNGVIENLDITANGDDNSLDFGYTTGLVNVTVAGAGDLALWLDDSTKVASYDASGLAGDLSSSVSSSVDVNVVLGSGNDWFGIYAEDAVTTDTDFVTADMDSGAGNDWVSVGGWWAAGSGVVTNLATGAGNDWVDLNSNTGNTDNIDLGDDNDYFRINAAFDATLDTVVGGAGNDTLILNAAEFTTANMAAISGFETLVAEGGGTYDLDNEAGLTTLVAGGVDEYGIGPDAWWDPSATADMSNFTGNSDVVFDDVGSSVTKLVLNYTNTQSITFDLKTDGAANALLVDIGNGEYDVIVGTTASDAVVVDDIETLTINSIGNDGDTASATISDNTIQALFATDMTKLVITGDSNLTLNGISTGAGSTATLTKIDASAFTGKLTINEASNTASGVEFLGGSKADTYFGTNNGDTIKANAGADVITLGLVGAADTLVFGAGDSKVGAMDGYTGFVSGEDTIDLGVFGFTGTQSSAILDKGNINATIAAWTATTTVVDFFASVGVDRGVAISSDGANTYVVVDANSDGNFSAADDMLVMLTGTATVALPDFGF